MKIRGRTGRAAFGAALIVTLLLLVAGVLASAWVLLSPILQDAALCRDRGNEALRQLEEYVAEAVTASSIRSRFTEICDSSLGVSYAADLDPSVQGNDIEAAFVSKGCRPLDDPADDFQCVTDGPR